VSAVALERRAVRGRGERARGAATLFDDVGGEPTLDRVLSRAWEGLAAQRAVACPVCGGEMGPDDGAAALPAGGRCRSCETTLT
jgi:hypothetical protein